MYVPFSCTHPTLQTIQMAERHPTLQTIQMAERHPTLQTIQMAERLHAHNKISKGGPHLRKQPQLPT